MNVERDIEREAVSTTHMSGREIVVGSLIWTTYRTDRSLYGVICQIYVYRYKPENDAKMFDFGIQLSDGVYAHIIVPTLTSEFRLIAT